MNKPNKQQTNVNKRESEKTRWMLQGWSRTSEEERRGEWEQAMKKNRRTGVKKK
jgi:hypothetical protein